MVFLFSVALAYGLTNIDGLFAFLALSSAGRRRQAVTGFLSAQVVVIGGAYVAGAGAAFMSPGRIGLLGLVPIGLGLFEIWKNVTRKTQTGSAQRSSGSLIGTVAIFIALSTDTFVLMAAFFADSHEEMDPYVFLGGILAVAGLLALGTALSRGLAPGPKTERFFERLAPFVMIAAGLYILFDTATDVL
jgi:cadmium resistance protein CadD (predicted permease)